MISWDTIAHNAMQTVQEIDIDRKPQDLIPHEILSKVVLTGDLSTLDDLEKMIYINAYCKSLNLNPLTKPFDIIDTDGRKVLYARKDCTEQLRKINKVAVKSLTKEIIGDNTYVVTAHVCTPDGREDIATGVVSLAGKSGDKIANAMMKAETKAKRRATLSICGLGIPDESELDTFESNRYQQKYQETTTLPSPSKLCVENILAAKTLDELKEEFTKAYSDAKGNKNLQSEIMKAKDKRKQELDNPIFDQSTGEILKNIGYMPGEESISIETRFDYQGNKREDYNPSTIPEHTHNVNLGDPQHEI